MSIDHPGTPRPLPDHANLRHLKDQAKDLVKAGTAASITDAQFRIARLYGFASWPKLKAYVDSLEEIGQLKQAIDTNDIDRVNSMMTRTDAAQRSAWLWQRWATHVGCRMPCAMGITKFGETGHGRVDDRTRVGCAPGR